MKTWHTLAIVLLIGLLSFTYAAEPDLIIIEGSADATKPGSKNAHFDYSVMNNSAEPFEFISATMVFTNSQGLTVRQLQPISANIPVNGSLDIAFEVDVSDKANTGTRAFQISFELSSGEEYIAPGFFYLFILDDSAVDMPPPPDIPAGERTYRPAAEFSHTLGNASGFSPGKENSITFYVQNRGDTAIRNAEFIIELPEGMSVYNASTGAFVGTISIGQRIGRTFSIMVYDDTEGGRAYPITIKVTGLDRANKPVNLERTFYIPVTGTGSGAVRDILIENISFPSDVSVDSDFTLTFSVRNTGTSTIRNIKVYSEMPEEIINKSNATFVVDSIGPEETKAFSIVLSASKGSNRSFPIKIAAEPLSGNKDSEIVQYVSVYVAGGGEALTPQLIVDQYSYGGSSIMAGKEFYLNLGLLNTSNKELSNIKVTILSDDGTFVPVDSSNSFFIDRIRAGGRHTKTLRLSAKPSAEQKTTGITVKMSYEDSAGGTFTADDTISIPVMQVMRLSVDEIVPPYECYAGSPGSSTVQFYNMGKTTLNNLMINAEGDFDIMESNSYYVGNMEGGNSDTYTFIFIPRDTGVMKGKVIFTYENIDGDPIVHEVDFEFNVMEMPVWDDWYPEENMQRQTPWALIIFGIILAAAVVGVFVWRKARKAKLNKMLEIQELTDE